MKTLQTSREYLKSMIQCDKVNGCEFFNALDAIGHFFFGYETELSDAYKNRLTDSREASGAVYVRCSEWLLDREYEIMSVLNDNDDLALWEVAKDLEAEIDAILL